MTDDPEVGTRIRHGHFTTNYHDVGSGQTVLLLHGSGPGVTAWANWRLALPVLGARFRVLAPDVAGFGYTDVDSDVVPDIPMWIDQVHSFLDRLDIPQVDLVGNSFGGALALWFATTHPERVRKIALMGSVGAPFTLTPGLDAVWGYEPSVAAMKRLLEYFVYDTSRLPANLAELRYAASVKPGAQERWASLFPAPRQRWIDALRVPDDRLNALTHETLIIHGRDDQVIPLETSTYLVKAIEHAGLVVYPHTGHWVQIERAGEFGKLLTDFLRS